MLPALLLIAAGASATSSAAIAKCRDGDDEVCLALEGARGTTRSAQVAKLTEELARCGPDRRKCAPDARTVAVLEELCLLGADAEACAEAASRRRDGLGVPRDAKRALGLFRAACSLGRWLACNDVSVSGDRLGSKISARMFKRSCERGDARACRDAADHITMMSFPGGDVWAETRPLYQKACEGGDGGACYSLAVRAESVGEKQRLFVKGCELGAPDSCYEAAQGVGPKDPKRRVFLQRACDRSVSEACRELK